MTCSCRLNNGMTEELVSQVRSIAFYDASVKYLPRLKNQDGKEPLNCIPTFSMNLYFNSCPY